MNAPDRYERFVVPEGMKKQVSRERCLLPLTRNWFYGRIDVQKTLSIFLVLEKSLSYFSYLEVSLSAEEEEGDIIAMTMTMMIFVLCV